MSPTSYQAAPPRTLTIANARISVKLRSSTESELFEVGRSYFGNPGIVVGSEAGFLLQAVNLALHGGHLVRGQRRNRFDLLPDGAHSARDLLFSIAAALAGRGSAGLDFHAIH